MPFYYRTLICIGILVVGYLTNFDLLLAAEVLTSAKDVSTGLSEIAAKRLMFPPKENGFIFQTPLFTYDLSNPEILIVGPLSITKHSFQVELYQSGDPESQLMPAMQKAGKVGISIFWVQWPKEFSGDQAFTAIDPGGNVVFELPINSQVRNDWEKFVAGIPEGYSDLVDKLKKGIGFFQIPDIIAKVGEDPLPLRFCFTERAIEGEETFKTTLCSPRYSFKARESFVRVSLRRESNAPKLLINDTQPGFKGAVSFGETNAPFVFFAETSEGASIEAKIKPVSPNFRDLVFDSAANVYIATGSEPLPFGWNDHSMTADKENFAFDQFWDQTIGDFRQNWKMKSAPEKLEFYFPAKGGLYFLQKLTPPAIPPVDEDRVQITEGETNSTYLAKKTVGVLMSGGVSAVGEPPVVLSVSTPQQAISSSSPLPEDIPIAPIATIVPESPNVQDSRLYLWEAPTPEVSVLNLSKLETLSIKGKLTQSYEFYRGYPGEFSTRLTGISGVSGVSVLGDLALGYWFEDMFRNNGYWSSKLRWGTSIKMFRSLTPIHITKANLKAQNQQSQGTSIAAVNADLKYRFVPGIWGRDETWGATINYHSLNIVSRDLNALGVGFFWGRSMPMMFDQLMSLFPLMKYPKFVDLDFIFYPVSLKSNVKLRMNYHLNFHGKIFWKETFFGEAGFGLKRYYYSFPSERVIINFQSLYLTLGLGISF
jgi:hypothetical protein